MRTFLAVLVISSLVLSSCGRLRDSRMNPGNWFSKSSSQSVSSTTSNPSEANPLIPEQSSILKRDKREVYLGTPVDQITDVKVERIPSGALIRVTGISRQQGAHEVRLTSDHGGDPVDGVLTFTLKALQPTTTPQGSQLRRTIHAARFVSNNDLDNTRTIRIVGERNVHTTRR